jgi:hypothetical protein
MPTGQFRTIPGRRLPTFVSRAVAARGGAAPATTTAASSVPVVEERAEEELPPVPAPLLDEGGREPTALGQAVPSSRPEGEPTYTDKEVAMATTPNLWRDRSLIAGPVAAAMGVITKVPGLGDPMREVTLARSQATYLAEEVIKVFLKSAQNSVTEQKMIDAITQIKPAVMRDPEAYGTQLIALDSILNQVIVENEAKSDPGQLGGSLTPAQRTESREKLFLLKKLQSQLGLPPKVFSVEEFQNLPVGTEVLWKGITPAKVTGR